MALSKLPHDDVDVPEAVDFVVEHDIACPVAAKLTSAETVDFANAKPTPELLHAESVDEFLRHLDDACPLITYDSLEAEEIRARYIIGEEIGSGSIGQVIEAMDQHLSRGIAIKVLHGDAGVSRDRLARFIAEAQITAQLEHPTIIPVYEIGRMPGGMPYFAMKRVRGESLDDIINNLRIGDTRYQRWFSGKHLIRTFYRLCQGVAYAHARGVVHRDLKPANILIGEFGVVQVMDWGLAKVMGVSDIKDVQPVQTVRDAPDLGTLDGLIAGTPAYMSPEQARGEIENVGPQSDVYSLGLILAELLTLMRVYRSARPEQTLNEVRAAGPVEVSELRAAARVDPELEAIVRKCTDPLKVYRYEDAGELTEDLRKYLEDRQISVSPDQHHRRVVKWTRRNPMLAGFIYGLLAALAAGAIWSGWFRMLFR